MICKGKRRFSQSVFVGISENDDRQCLFCVNLLLCGITDAFTNAYDHAATAAAVDGIFSPTGVFEVLYDQK